MTIQYGGFMTRYALAFCLCAAGCTSSPVAPSASPDAARPDVLEARKGGSGPFALSLAPKGWRFIPTGYRASGDASGLVLTIPAAPTSLNYAYRSSPSKVVAGAITVTATVEGGPFLPSEPCGAGDTNTAMRVLVMAYGEQWHLEFGRWWSNPIRVPLVPGAYTVTVPIAPEQWSSVYGKRGSDVPAAFADALRNVSHLGVTFGSCFFGHGVYSEAPGRVVITEYRVTP